MCLHRSQRKQNPRAQGSWGNTTVPPGGTEGLTGPGLLVSPAFLTMEPPHCRAGPAENRLHLLTDMISGLPRTAGEITFFGEKIPEMNTCPLTHKKKIWHQHPKSNNLGNLTLYKAPENVHKSSNELG